MINLNINDDNSNITDFIYCYEKFGSTPNRYIMHSLVCYEKTSEFLKKTEFINRITEYDFSINEKVLVKYNDDVYISYLIIECRTDHESFSNISFFYREEDNLPEIEKIINSLKTSEDEDCEEYKEIVKNSINVVNVSNGVLELSPLPIEVKNIDNIKLFYNKETLKSVNDWIKKLDKLKKGLSIFSGERGTGKTEMIKYLVTKLKKDITYIPNNLIDQTINNPEFKNILFTLKDSLLIIDDCEIIYSKGGFFNNLMQLIDGIESDDLSLNFLLIFNNDEIDGDLLDSNNLIDVIEFNYLESKEIEKLSKYVGITFKLDKSDKTAYKLIDILNYKNGKLNKNKTIGF